MNESIREETSPGDDLSDEAKRVVKRGTNSVYEPVMFTAEVAEALDISEDAVRDALNAHPAIDKKSQGSPSGGR